MKYLSVCSGIEAVSVAWQPLGWEPAMFAEIDPFCCSILRSRYRASRPIYMPSPHDAPDRKEAKRRAAAIRNVIALPADGDVINAGDFTRIGADDAGTIELLAGGTPYQSFSIAGKRAGLDDPRGNLTIEFARLAGRLRPLWVVWENVPGVLSIDDGRTFGAFLGMLVELGYGIAYRVLDAQYFGVPQRRRRVFVVGCAGNWRAAAAVLLDRHSLSGHSPPRREAWQGAAGTLGARSCSSRGVQDAHSGHLLSPSTGNKSHCLNAGGMGRQDFETETLIAHALSAEAFDASEDVSIAPTLRSMEYRGAHANGGGQLAVAFAQNQAGDVLSGEVMHALGTNPNATGRNAPTVAFTLHGSDGTAGTATPTSVAEAVRTRAPGSIENSSTTIAQYGMAVRRLAPRECERLQGFPDDYTLVEYRGRPAADGPRYRALGNSMAVPIMRWIGERIASVDAILRRDLGNGRIP